MRVSCSSQGSNYGEKLYDNVKDEASREGRGVFICGCHMTNLTTQNVPSSPHHVIGKAVADPLSVKPTSFRAVLTLSPELSTRKAVRSCSMMSQHLPCVSWDYLFI